MTGRVAYRSADTWRTSARFTKRSPGARSSSPLGVVGRREPGRLPRGQTGADDPGGAQRLVRGAQAAPGHEKVVEVPRLQAAEGDIVALPVAEILVGCAQVPVLPELDRPARTGHRVLEAPARQHVIARELIAPDHATRFADTDLRRRVGDESSSESRHRFEEFGDGEGALAPFLLSPRQKVASGRVLLNDPAQRQLAHHLAGLRG